MQIPLNIDLVQFVNAIDILPREDQEKIADHIEEKLLAEWDNFENDPETIKRVSESFQNYNSKDVISIDEL